MLINTGYPNLVCLLCECARMYMYVFLTVICGICASFIDHLYYSFEFFLFSAIIHLYLFLRDFFEGWALLYIFFYNILG